MNKRWAPDELERLPLFHDLAPAELERVSAVVLRRDAQAGESLIRRGDSPTSIFLIVSGGVRLEMRPSNSPRELLLELRGTGEIVGELAVLRGQAHIISARAQTDCLLAELTRASFWNVLWPLPAVPCNMAFVLAERVRRLSEQNQALALLSARDRLARQLVVVAHDLQQRDEDGSWLVPRLKQDDWAQLVGASRAQISSSCAEWRRRGWLLMEPERLRLPSLEPFEKIVDEGFALL